MFTSKQLRNRARIAIGAGILVLLASLFLFIVAVRKQLSVSVPPQTTIGSAWHGLTVGLSTRNDVHATFGSPGTSMSTIDEYCMRKVPCHDPELTFYYDDNDILSFMRLYEFGFSSLMEVFHQYGNPQYQVSGIDGPAFIYDSQGIIVNSVMKPNDEIRHARVDNVNFILPCSIECIMQQHRYLFAAVNPQAQPFVTPTP